MTAHGVTGFPTILLFKNGKLFMKYQGERSSEALVNWFKSVSQPSVFEIESSELTSSVSTKLTEGKQVLISSDKNSVQYLIDALIGENIFGFVGLVVEDLSSASELYDGDLSTVSGLWIAAEDDVKPITFNLDNTDEFITWYYDVRRPSVERIDFPDAFLSHSKAGKLSMFLFVEGDYEGSPESPSATDDLISEEQRASLESLTQRFSDLGVLYIPIGRYGQYFQSVMGEDAPLPSFALIQWAAGRPSRTWYHPKYIDVDHVLDSLVNTPSVIYEFIERVVSGTETWKPKSAPIPESQEGPVTVVVADSINDIVLDSTKDVLLEIYSPNCPHCKRLEPAYNELAEFFSHYDSVVVSKIDGTINDIPADITGDFKGFPTIVMFPANNKDSPIVYNGDRSFESLRDFVIENVAIPIDSDSGHDL